MYTPRVGYTFNGFQHVHNIGTPSAADFSQFELASLPREQ